MNLLKSIFPLTTYHFSLFTLSTVVTYMTLALLRVIELAKIEVGLLSDSNLIRFEL